MQASKAAKTGTTAAKLSKHTRSGANQVQARRVSTYMDNLNLNVEHHGSGPGAQLEHQQAPANAATAVYAPTALTANWQMKPLSRVSSSASFQGDISP